MPSADLRRTLVLAAVAVSGLVASGCTGSPTAGAPASSTTTVVTSPTSMVSPTAPPSAASPRPAWLGTRVLPVTESGFGEVQPTPPELVDRRFETLDVLPPPASDGFESSVSAVPDDVLERSTWTPACPVARDELRYLTVSFHGFDEELHTGELLVNADVVDVVRDGFSSLFAAGFPIEEMRVVASAELDLPPTGDGNNTTAFVCRPTRGAASWSAHAYGRAVDVNPFHNPYRKGDVVLPELASAYLDRTASRPGMLDATLVTAFTDAGWGWGGNWTSLEDYMHVSADGR